MRVIQLANSYQTLVCHKHYIYFCTCCFLIYIFLPKKSYVKKENRKEAAENSSSLSVSETHVRQFRAQFLAGINLSIWVLKYHVKDIVSMAMLSQDTTQIKMEVEKTKVVKSSSTWQGGAQCNHHPGASPGGQY